MWHLKESVSIWVGINAFICSFLMLQEEHLQTSDNRFSLSVLIHVTSENDTCMISRKATVKNCKNAMQVPRSAFVFEILNLNFLSMKSRRAQFHMCILYRVTMIIFVHGNYECIFTFIASDIIIIK